MGDTEEKKETTHAIEEGPYYKKDSPERKMVVEGGTAGEKLIITGRVLDKQGNPISGAWVDFWQANSKGEYDNSGYNLRGHQYTDETGRFHLETIMPALYGFRTPHVHAKVQPAPDSKTFTTQLYFPDKSTNRSDPLFDPALVMNISDTPEGKQAQFDFVLDI